MFSSPIVTSISITPSTEIVEVNVEVEVEGVKKSIKNHILW